ncbi:alpha-mannosidase [Paenibacillus sp. LHD-38]|uniref:alpha-mannosidase n=1 Tax=Paenibacillus sp. LHD-38 TaxID=3072143 RepID=UPI00280FB632|nr:alpha-mannosidase [Paenibacillus sp. LHD-38]MDQ8734510.1 alpha-mannosidase [Paenibacillus sp. LHD-38]
MHRKTAHIISHTHWDREWYLPFEKHRFRLVRLMDELMEVLENNTEFRTYHLDGQTILLEDYLEVRPDRRAQLEKLIRDGRIHIGPWYILQDEFLTSSEANIRNLLYGHKDAARYGNISKLGYFPDSFGNMGQAAQILTQADILTAVFGRGVTPTGFNNTVDHQSNYESPYSEMIWQSPDGSEVLGILFANWYSNGNEVPKDEAAAKSYWESRLAAAQAFASTPHLLFMNGCDHQPVQRDLPDAVAVAKQLFPDIEFVHSNFDDYIAAVKENLPEELQVVKGELRSQRTNGWGTLVNTASSRIYLKQANERGQTWLEKVAEPLAAMAYTAGKAYPHHWFEYGWKTLMKNHPHDSICGCSIDEVHREMTARFEKSLHVAESIVEQSAEYLEKQIDTRLYEPYGASALPIVVWNTTGWGRSGVVRVKVDVDRVYFREGISFDEMRRSMKQLPLGQRKLVDPQGKTIPASVKDLGIQFGYDLPDDQFRQPYFARSVELEFEAVNVQALGHLVYAWVEGSGSEGEGNAPLLVTGERTMENDYVRIVIANNGTWELTEKQSGHTFKGLGVYENTGDIGNEYMYKQADGDVALTTEHLAADIRLVENTPYRASFETVHVIQVPEQADELLQQEREELVWFTQRKARRSQKLVPMEIKTKITLDKHARGVLVRTTFDNTSKDHRLRVLFPSDLHSATHYADSIFEIAERDNEPAPEWKNPSNCHHQHAFASVYDGQMGLTVANKGLNEYEILRDGRNTLAITLLRAVAELGDWGVFPTPEAQCQGTHTAEYIIFPHSGDPKQTGVYAEAYQFQVPWTALQSGVHGGTIPPVHSWMPWSGETLAFSSLKVSEMTGDIVARWYHLGANQENLWVQPQFPCGKLHTSDVLERRKEAVLANADGNYMLPVKKYEIITLSMEIKGK